MSVYYPRHESCNTSGHDLPYHQGRRYKWILMMTNEFVSRCHMISNMSLTVTERSSVGPLPGIQARKIRRNVHGKLFIWCTYILSKRKRITSAREYRIDDKRSSSWMASQLLFMYFSCIHVCKQYKVPTGCIVINNPSAYTRATVTTLAPRYTGIISNLKVILFF